MKPDLNLTHLEKKTFVTSHEDGIVDIVVGFTLILTGILMLSDLIAMGGMIWLFALFIKPLKKKITYPRIGYVKFSRPQVTRITKMLSYFMVFGTVVFLMFTISLMGQSMRTFLREYMLIIVGVSFALMAFLGGMLSRIKRWNYYAILILLVFILELKMNLGFPYALMILGAAMFSTGMTLLIKFIRKYPVTGRDV